MWFVVVWNDEHTLDWIYFILKLVAAVLLLL